MMSHGLQQLIAQIRAAQFCTGRTAAGNDDFVTIETFLRGFDIVAAGFFSDGQNLAAASNRDTAGFQCEAENVHNAVGLIGKRLDFSVVFRNGQKAEAAEKLQRFFDGKCLQRPGYKLRITAMVM